MYKREKWVDLIHDSKFDQQYMNYSWVLDLRAESVCVSTSGMPYFLYCDIIWEIQPALCPIQK